MKESLEILGGAISGNPLPNGTVVTGGLNPAISNNLTITNIYDGTTDYTPPPTPTGFSISSGFTNILLSWDDPNASGTFLNYAYTEIWRSVNNVLGNAVLQGFAPGAVFSDPVGTSKTYYYWIRFVSQADVAGPYNSSTGTIGGTGLVGGVDLGPLIVDATKLAADAVESGKIKDAAITTTKIANLAVGNAAIANLAVTNAKIANLAVDDAKIANLAVNKLTAGSINVGQYIQSTGFSSGTNGWYIGGNGVAEFGAAVIRGQITASQIDSRGLSIKDANGVVILAAGTALNYSYITPDSGWLNSALTPSITAAQNTANSASSAASTAQNTANSASSAASTAQGTANSASSTANTALSTANSKLSRAGDTVTGRITFAVADGMFAGSDTNNGVYFGSTGLLGRKNGNTTFYINTAGDAVFGGQLVVGGSPAISGTTMTGNGALINPTGTFAIGNSATNVTFNGTTLKLNGNVVAAENMLGGATLPGYIRAYTGSGTVTIGVSDWTYILMDDSPINNTFGVIEAGASFSYFPAGSYYYELTIPVTSTNSDVNGLVCTAIGGFPDGINFGILSNCGASSIGDWQTMPIYGVGRFTLATAGYAGPVIQSLDGFPTIRIFGRSGFCTVVWRVFRA
jgi:guanyl-specific ribonuclease Sa